MLQLSRACSKIMYMSYRPRTNAERSRVVGANDGIIMESEGSKQIVLGNVSTRHFGTYEVDRLQIAQGDILRITRNGKTIVQQHWLNNGATYRLKGFTENGIDPMTKTARISEFSCVMGRMRRDCEFSLTMYGNMPYTCIEEEY